MRDIIIKASKFEEVVGKILTKYFDPTITQQPMSEQKDKCYRYDFIGKSVCYEVKYVRDNNRARFQNLVMNYCSRNIIPMNLVLVVNVLSYNDISENIMVVSNDINQKIKVLTLDNLLYFTNEDEKLKSELISCIEFSTENVIPLKPHESIYKELNLAEISHKNSNKKIVDYSKRLKQIKPGKKDATKFENFCEDFVKEIFKDNIKDVESQIRNNQDLYRFDIMATLKENPRSFWKFIYDKFNSAFILFECKNYVDKIGQHEIYTTERYLYNNALRNVAVMFTREGVDENGKRAIQGILREYGKLIIVLNNEDIEFMTENYIKMTNGEDDYISPSDILDNKVKDFLKNLDK